MMPSCKKKLVKTLQFFEWHSEIIDKLWKKLTAFWKEKWSNSKSFTGIPSNLDTVLMPWKRNYNEQKWLGKFFALSPNSMQGSSDKCDQTNPGTNCFFILSLHQNPGWRENYPGIFTAWGEGGNRTVLFPFKGPFPGQSRGTSPQRPLLWPRTGHRPVQRSKGVEDWTVKKT